ncbi:hypothetical protein CYMTET_40625 [Cymbomonas tetramitiformis]|uniref:Uncharacterized protein n=1 Tax=Cymbomonas tetramitiformis TaxID=36881 RepID=A0AAE0C9R0_9CHLO|nr:hypothetical protein CYMTET_40625 [Cymbomonas tetramitiformis]
MLLNMERARSTQGLCAATTTLLSSDNTGVHWCTGCECHGCSLVHWLRVSQVFPLVRWLRVSRVFQLVHWLRVSRVFQLVVWYQVSWLFPLVHWLQALQMLSLDLKSVIADNQMKQTKRLEMLEGATTKGLGWIDDEEMGHQMKEMIFQKEFSQVRFSPTRSPTCWPSPSVTGRSACFTSPLPNPGGF